MEHFYESIEGWIDFQSIYRQAVQEAENGARFVEVGSWKGKSAAFMAVEIINSGKTIWFNTVDHWKGDSGTGEPVVWVEGNCYPVDLQQTFLENMKRGGVSGYVQCLTGTSVEIAKIFPDESLDFVFIDGHHAYESVILDLKSWFPKVKPGKMIAGHDYNDAEIADPGVQQAVKEFFGKYKVELRMGEWTQSWIVRKPCGWFKRLTNFFFRGKV